MFLLLPSRCIHVLNLQYQDDQIVLLAGWKWQEWAPLKGDS